MGKPSQDHLIMKVKLTPTPPHAINNAVKNIISVLKLNESDISFLGYKKPRNFTPGHNDCHLNVWVQCNHEGGSPVSGWIIAEDPAVGFIEAQFHTVWCSPDGELQDITPRTNEEKIIMFFPDRNRKITFFEHKNSAAINTYENVKILNNIIINPVKQITIVSNTDFSIKHGFYIEE